MPAIDLTTLPTLTLSDGRHVYLVDSGCDTSPKMHLVWLGQISPDFIAVYGDNEGEAHEYAADGIGFKALDNEYVNTLCKEFIADGDTEEKAWEHATEGMLPLNGGAEWIGSDDYGFWNASKKDRALMRAALAKMRADWNA